MFGVVDCHQTSILLQVIKMVSGHPFKDLSLSVHPLHFHLVDSCRLSQPEMQAQITLRQVASSASDLYPSAFSFQWSRKPAR